MSKTIKRGNKPKKHIVRAVFDNGDDYEWSGCGWVPSRKGKRYKSRHDADMIAFDVNCSKAGITAWGDDEESTE